MHTKTPRVLGRLLLSLSHDTELQLVNIQHAMKTETQKNSMLLLLIKQLRLHELTGIGAYWTLLSFLGQSWTSAYLSILIAMYTDTTGVLLFHQFQPSNQGSVFIQLKFQNTKVSVARAMKTHMASLRAPLLKNQMKIMCVPTAVQTISKAQGPFPQEVINFPGSRKEAKMDHFPLTTRKDFKCMCRHRHGHKILSSYKNPVHHNIPKCFQTTEYLLWWMIWILRLLGFMKVFCLTPISSKYLGSIWFVVNLWYSYS